MRGARRGARADEPEQVAPPLAERKAARKTTIESADTATVTSRLPNSTQGWKASDAVQRCGVARRPVGATEAGAGEAHRTPVTTSRA